VLRGLESRLKESFNEMHRWQSAVEVVVQQAVTEGCKDQTAELQLKYQDRPQLLSNRLTDIKPSDQQAFGKSTEATLAQLEDDIAKLRLELKGGSLQTGQSSVSDPVSRDWSRPRALKPEVALRGDMPRASAPAEIDVQSWKNNLWHGSSLSRRGNGEISRLYDELLRLEEEEKAMRKPAFAMADQSRRRSSSSSNLASRKSRIPLR